MDDMVVSGRQVIGEGPTSRLQHDDLKALLLQVVLEFCPELCRQSLSVPGKEPDPSSPTWFGSLSRTFPVGRLLRIQLSGGDLLIFVPSAPIAGCPLKDISEGSLTGRPISWKIAHHVNGSAHLPCEMHILTPQAKNI